MQIIASVVLTASLAACDEQRPAVQKDTNTSDKGDSLNLTVSLVPIAPGGAKPVSIEPSEAKEFDGNPEQIAAGRQLYQAYNCVGCHFNGGGGMGPALMDDTWIYGSSMENIAATIIEGRPAGMPTFRSMVTGDQVWQLAAYVRSLSGLPKEEPATEEVVR